MKAHFDWTGQRWGSLVATQYASKAQRKRTGARWLFRCDCGRAANLHIRAVRRGEHTTCGHCVSANFTEHDAAQAIADHVASGNAKIIVPPPVRSKPFAWCFPRVIGPDGQPVSPVWRAHAAT